MTWYKLILIIIFLIANFSSKGQSLISDTLSFSILKNYNTSSETNPFDTTLNGVYFYDYLRILFPSKFSEKEYFKTFKKYTVDGKYNVLSKDKKIMLQAYEENGGTGCNYYSISYFKAEKRKIKRYLLTKENDFITESRIKLGMQFTEFQSIMKGVSYKLINNKETTYYYCWYPKEAKCFDIKMPSYIFCDAFYYEYHFVNDILVKYGFGKINKIPNW